MTGRERSSTTRLTAAVKDRQWSFVSSCIRILPATGRARIGSGSLRGGAGHWQLSGSMTLNWSINNARGVRPHAAASASAQLRI